MNRLMSRDFLVWELLGQKADLHEGTRGFRAEFSVGLISADAGNYHGA